MVMSYYNIEQTLGVFRKELPEPELPFDLPQLADLCRQGILTPAFPYQGFISAPVGYEDNGRPIHAPEAIEPYDSYLYSNKLIKLIDGYADKLELWTASTPQGLHDLDFYSRPMRNTYDDIDPITFMVKLENIRFAADDVQKYIQLQYSDDLTTPEQLCIIELESEVTALKKQLRQQADAPADNKPKNQDSKIVVYLAFILAQKLPKYRKPNLSINAQQVGKAITAMAQELGLDQDDMHGFKRPDARLRTLINDNKELLSHFETLIKPKE